MTRILQVCNSTFYLSKFLLPLIRELERKGHRVECLCETKPGDESLAQLGLPVHAFSFPFRPSPIEFYRAVRDLKRFLLDHRFDCVNSHNRNASIVARIAGHAAGVPVNIYTAHGFYFHDGQSPGARFLSEQLERALARITTLTLSQSAEDARLMTGHGWIRPENIQVIGNGIDVSKFHPASRAPAASRRPFRVGAMGRLVRGKGFEDLLLAFSRFSRIVPDSELLFIGGNTKWDLDSSESLLCRQIRQLGLERKVRITGFVPDAEAYLAECDVFVHPSYREGMPRALLEAMCMGIPVIASAIRGAREIIRCGENGYVFAPGSIDSIEALLLAFARMPHEERARLGRNARNLVLAEYSEAAYVERQVAAIEAACSTC